jgi:hypothetical protein
VIASVPAAEHGHRLEEPIVLTPLSIATAAGLRWQTQQSVVIVVLVLVAVLCQP